MSVLLPASPVTLTCPSSRPSPSTRQDDFFILQEDAADSFLESVFKTEFVSLLCKRFEEAVRRPLPLTFSDTYDPHLLHHPRAGHSASSSASRTGRNAPVPRPLPPRVRQGWNGEVIPSWGAVGTPTASSSPHRLQFRVKKEGWGGGGTRSVTFSRGSGDVAMLKASGRTLSVSVGDGLPKSSSESTPNRETETKRRSGRGGPLGAGPSIGTNQGCGGGASGAGQGWVKAMEGRDLRDLKREHGREEGRAREVTNDWARNMEGARPGSPPLSRL